MEKFDHIDIALIRALQRDSSLSQRALADIVGLSQNACWKRLSRLRESGLLGQSTLRLDPARWGLNFTAFVMVRTRRHDRLWLDRFRQLVLAIPNIVDFHRIAGEYDYLLKVVTHDMKEFDGVYRQLIEQMEFDTVTSHIVMEAIVDNRELPI
jgi:Lrp/AsnC family transcriptional regulator